MLEKHTHDGLLKLKNQIIDSTLVAGVLAGIVAFIISYFPFAKAYRSTDFLATLQLLAY